MLTLAPNWTVPTQEDLPCDDGIPVESQRHKLQMDLLIDGLSTWLEQRADGYVGGNMFIYFSLDQVRNQDFRGPDFFLVLNVPKKERRSWVVWEEGKAPDVVIELLSETTADLDKTVKKQIYQDQLRVPEYYWYDPFHPEDWAGFALHHGVYEPIPVNAQGYLESQCTGLVLRRWVGTYRGVEATWLRWATPDGEVLPTAQELAQRAQQAAQQAQQRAERLAQKLRELGVNPDEIG
ncbi:MAG: Uma2 family endonuclease [Gloeomargarita sp. SKYBB_i_bin120]|nr:Uma2 family endonuclease [Gloeomargarita sp. SKYG98]MCS7293442.1 Uma2 family endonuclease [Gloeomargarita sp. SKYB120]MDW8179008.1 Uma2 family endonuclease [Gloeomargarita sp. SKYBB_i_bin120]